MSLPVEHGITPVRGYRTFVVSPCGQLCSLSAQSTWQQDETTAECLRSYPSFNLGICGDDDTAQPILNAEHMADCTCGLYAWHLPRNLPDISLDRAAAVVEGYGTVIWCPSGWRASKARIIALCSEGGVIPAGYGDVPQFTDLDAMVAAYPPQVDPADVPLPESPMVSFARQLQVTLTVDVSGLVKAFENLSEQFRRAGLAQAALPADVQERALELQKHRNTGPVRPTADQSRRPRSIR